ncbi:MAG: hypothetical protein D6723_05835 [Acidobacteria bacterium]|nr:MAG: hypothetical protein D6723_05835 [Acidobacteriota bacterium]
MVSNKHRHEAEGPRNDRLNKEGNQFSSLCLELEVAFCGKTREEAFEGLKAAVETSVTYLVEEGRESKIYRPVPQEAIPGFLLGK